MISLPTRHLKIHFSNPTMNCVDKSLITLILPETQSKFEHTTCGDVYVYKLLYRSLFGKFIKNRCEPLFRRQHGYSYNGISQCSVIPEVPLFEITCNIGDLFDPLIIRLERLGRERLRQWLVIRAQGSIAGLLFHAEGRLHSQKSHGLISPVPFPSQCRAERSPEVSRNLGSPIDQ